MAENECIHGMQYIRGMQYIQNAIHSWIITIKDVSMKIYIYGIVQCHVLLLGQSCIRAFLQ